MGRYNHSLSLDATYHGIKKLPNHIWICCYHFCDTIGYHSNSLTCKKTPLSIALGAYNSKTARWNFLYYQILISITRRNFLAKFKKFWLRATLNFQNFKVALSPMYRFMVFMVFFPTGVFLYQTLETVLSMTVSKQRTAFLHFAWSLLQISFEQHDGARFLIPSGKRFGGD